LRVLVHHTGNGVLVLDEEKDA